VNKDDFLEVLHEKGRALYREMPWREDTRPYYILVSELMLQQTQVDRVIPKFLSFIERFPDEKALAAAPLADILSLWSGLGYNRRARFLHESAKKIINEYSGQFPESREELLRLPGVGVGTAGAITVYAFNQPVAFIETNVRTVYFHHFFPNGEKVSDAEMIPYIEETLDREYPREFYWALMDYGTWLKRNGAGRNMQSSHYKKQPALKGSVREVRGQIIKLLIGEGLTLDQLQGRLVRDDRFEKALDGLIKDGLIIKSDALLHLTK